MQLELFPSATIDMQSAAIQRRGYCLQLPAWGTYHTKGPHKEAPYLLGQEAEGTEDPQPVLWIPWKDGMRQVGHLSGEI